VSRSTVPEARTVVRDRCASPAPAQLSRDVGAQRSAGGDPQDEAPLVTRAGGTEAEGAHRRELLRLRGAVATLRDDLVDQRAEADEADDPGIVRVGDRGPEGLGVAQPAIPRERVGDGGSVDST
jgi:hypothetical protein